MSLYAQKFEGVRRSGSRIKRMNPAAWQLDRARMFKKPMTVALTDITVGRAGLAFTVRATQTWESGTYKDAGPKQFLVVREAQSWRIAREEMLSSIRSTPAWAAAGELLFVWHGAPVLNDSAKPEWRLDAGTVDKSSLSARWRVNVDALPSDLRRWLNAPLVLYDENAEECRAKIVGFSIVATADWHFGTVEEWRSGNVPDSEMVSQIWDGGAQLLVADLSASEGPCESPIIARLASLPRRDVVPFVTEKDSDVATRAQDELRRRVGDKANEAGGGSTWVATVSEGRRQIWFLNSAQEMCTPESIGVEATIVWDVNVKGSQPKLRLLGHEEQGSRTPKLLIDVEGDGEFEIIFEGFPSAARALLHAKDGKIEVPATLTIPFHDCPC